MIRIIKSREPSEWIERKNTPGYSYESDPALRGSLLAEQGYICAYCMNRIDTANSKIEHVKCRSRYPELALTYANMVICCEGKTDNELHCDSSKSDKDIGFDLFSSFFVNTISYRSKSGKILSSNSQYDDEINNVLNLNQSTIQTNRLHVLNGVIDVLNKKKQEWGKGSIRQLLVKWQSKDRENKLNPYCGIVIWFLNKKL